MSYAKEGEFDEREFEKYMEDLMSQAGIYGEEIKLVVFCPSTIDIDQLFREVRRRLTSSFKLTAKYGREISKEDFRRIVKSLAWMLSIDKSDKDLTAAEFCGDVEEAFRYLDVRRIEFLSGLKEDKDWIHIRKWEGESEEHRILKLPVYKTMKDYGYTDNDIKVEEVCKSEEGTLIVYLVPDLRVEGKIWAEVETLRGIRDPLDLIQEFQNKAGEISNYEEFWLVIPSFEIMMHRYRIQPLLKQLFDLFGKRIKISIWYPDIVNKRIHKLIEKSPYRLE